MRDEEDGGLARTMVGRIRTILRPWKSNEDNVEGLASTYASGLYITARGLSLRPDDELADLADRLQAVIDQPRPNFRDIFALETELARLLPEEMRERRYWEYRARFERVASPRELAAYVASGPPAPPSAASAAGSGGTSVTAIGDADNIALLGHVHRNYLLTVLREQAERDLKQWIQLGLMRALILYAIVLAALLLCQAQGWIPEQGLYFGIGISLFFLVGRLGAATSVVQRLQKAVREESRDAFFEITALCTGRRGISIAMMEGGIFAVLLYTIFAAGLGQHLGMSGGIFPQVEINSPADRTPDSGAEAGEAGKARSQERTNPPADGGPGLAATPTPATQPGPQAQPAPQAGPTPQAQATPPRPQTGAQQPQPRQPAQRTQQPASYVHNPFGWSSDPCDSNEEVCMPTFISQIGKHLGFRDYPDFFKMLLLAFLAGFAERLVPDALDRLVRRRASANEGLGGAMSAPAPLDPSRSDGGSATDSAGPVRGSGGRATRAAAPQGPTPD